MDREVRRGPVFPPVSFLSPDRCRSGGAIDPLLAGRRSATNEVDPGILQTFEIQPDGTLGPAIAHATTGGFGPTHILTRDDGTVAAMNVRRVLHIHRSGQLTPFQFGGGNGAILQADPSLNFERGDLIKFPVGPAGVSNPHQTVQFRDELLVPDRVRHYITMELEGCGIYPFSIAGRRYDMEINQDGRTLVDKGGNQTEPRQRTTTRRRLQ